MTDQPVWVIYRSPRGYPGKWVARSRGIDYVCESIEEARAVIPRRLHPTPRHPDDVPEIVETWM